jgi:hypothetical protein
LEASGSCPPARAANGQARLLVAKFKQMAGPDRAPVVERIALQARADLAAECDEKPWAIERRRCIATSTTHRMVTGCL